MLPLVPLKGWDDAGNGTPGDSGGGAEWLLHQAAGTSRYNPTSILSCNALVFTGLYRGILGIQPRYNRLYLNPHITQDIEGSEVLYRLRGREFRIGYSQNGTTVKVNNATITSRGDFGVWIADDGTLEVFTHDSETPALVQRPAASGATWRVNIDEAGARVVQED